MVNSQSHIQQARMEKLFANYFKFKVTADLHRPSFAIFFSAPDIAKQKNKKNIHGHK